MPIWPASPVHETADIVLVRWRLIRDAAGNVHAYGWNLTEGEGRVSSQFVTFDGKRLRGMTRSGRAYLLQGPPGFDSDAVYVFERWRRINAIRSHDDVSVQAGAMNISRSPVTADVVETPPEDQ